MGHLNQTFGDNAPQAPAAAAMAASAPGRITPHRAPPYEELDLS